MDIKFPDENYLDLVGEGGNRLHTYRYPVDNPSERKAIVYYLHGYGGHSGKMAFLGKALAENGFEFLAYDFRGFGKSQGKRGYGHIIF